MLAFLPHLTLAQTLFDVTGSLVNGTIGSGSGVTAGTFSGTFELVGNALTNWNIVMSSLSGPTGPIDAFTFTPSNSSSVVQVPDIEGIYTLGFRAGTASSPTDLNLIVQCSSGQNPCLSSTAATPLVPGSLYVTSAIFSVGNGEITPAATLAPEPSRLVLMGGGLAGIVEFWRKLFGTVRV